MPNWPKYKKGETPQPKIHFQFFENKVYWDVGSEWVDITAQFQRAMINYLTQYQTDLPEGKMRVSSFELEGETWHIGISPIKKQAQAASSSGKTPKGVDSHE